MDARKVITLLKSGPSEEEMAAKADLVNGKVPASELPSYVDDVLEYEDFEHFPAEGEEGKIYVDIQTGDTYRWGGTAYVRVGGSSVSYFPIPTGWNVRGTTVQLCQSIVDDSVATEGMVFFGKIFCSDLPSGLIQAEAIIEIIADDSANGKDIHIRLSSADTAPYHWEYSYAKINGGYVSPAGWVGYQPELVSGTNIKTVGGQSLLGSGDVGVGGLEVIPRPASGTLTQEQFDKLSQFKAVLSCLVGGQTYYLYPQYISNNEMICESVAHIDSIESSRGYTNMGAYSYRVQIYGADHNVTTARSYSINSYSLWDRRPAIVNNSTKTVQYMVQQQPNEIKRYQDGTIAAGQTGTATWSGLSIVFLTDGITITPTTGQGIIKLAPNYYTWNYMSGNPTFTITGAETETITPIPTLDIQRLFRTEYAISTNITNGSATGDSSIWTKETASVTLSADEGYVLPSTITVVGADDVYDDTTGVIALSNATGAVTVSATCPKVPPVKGDIITLDGGASRYRVLKMNGTVAEVMALDNVANSIFNNSSVTTTFSDDSVGQKYESSTLDNYMNSTFYNSLSTNIKAAIVQKAITQSIYQHNSSGISGYDFAMTGMSSTQWYKRKGQVLVGDRYCYALDLDDVAEYLGAGSGNTVSGADLNDMFFEQTTAIDKQVWLDTATNVASDCAINVFGNFGFASYSHYSYPYIVRPAFRINLSQVDYTKE